MSAYSSPVFSIAGAMPGEPEMTHWKTAYVNPDASVTTRVGRPRPHGPSLSIAGAMPVAPTMSQWHTAYPDGEGVYVQALRDAELRALAQGGRAEVLPFRGRRRALPKAKARPRQPAPHARNLLRFRRSMLLKARERAATLCQRGAMFPWRTINGEEASASYQAGATQDNLNADIAYAIRRYVDARGCHRAPLWVPPTMTVVHAAATMVQFGMRHLLVVDTTGEPVGVLSMREAFAILLRSVDPGGWLADFAAALEDVG